jgi:nitroreductase
MDFRELLKVRRAVREFEDREVPLSLIREILADSCEAPSGGNNQPWSFIVITSREVMKRISDESKGNILSLIEADPGSPLVKYKPILEMTEFDVFYGAPALVYIAGPKAVRSATVDCALAAGYFMLSAADRGLGTCWIDLGSAVTSSGLRGEIGLPDDHAIVATLALGYPKRVPGRPPRNEPSILKVVTD